MHRWFEYVHNTVGISKLSIKVTIMTMTNAQFKAAIKSVTRRGVSLENSCVELVEHVMFQMSEHGNGSAAMDLRAAIPQFVAKPKGFTQKALTEYIEVYSQFKFDTKSKTFKKDKGYNPQALPQENAFKFWAWEKEEGEKSTKTPAERLIEAIQRAEKELNDVEIDAVIRAHRAARQVAA